MNPFTITDSDEEPTYVPPPTPPSTPPRLPTPPHPTTPTLSMY